MDDKVFYITGSWCSHEDLKWRIALHDFQDQYSTMCVVYPI